VRRRVNAGYRAANCARRFPLRFAGFDASVAIVGMKAFQVMQVEEHHE
jgi:hypothetical protein